MKSSAIRQVSVLAAVALVCSPLAIAGTAAGGAQRAVSRTGPAYEVRSIYTSEFGVARPTGVSWDARRKALVVTGAAAGGGVKAVSVTPGERLLGSRTTSNVARPKVPSIRGLSGVRLGAVATDPGTGRRYVASKDGRRVYALSSSGAVVRTHDLSRVGIRDLQGMTFAPSSDTTDDPAEQSLYIADRGDASTLGRVAEVSLTEPVAPTAATVTGSLVETRDTSLWSPPSPDPSGVTYVPGTDRLLVSDGEVDEMQIYAGANLYNATRSGALPRPGPPPPTGTTLPWSNEPTGVAFNSTNGHLLVSDDDKKSIFEIASPGADGGFGTADDGAFTSFKTSTFGNTDPEDVGFDTLRGEMLMIDGLGKELFRLNPGPNGVFNGVPPGGDDIATQFDVEQFGALDPEGVAYDAVRDTVVVVDSTSNSLYELDTNGSLISRIDISSVGAQKAAGITIAPASNGSGAWRYYVVDRGLDNNSHPDENDGKLYEISASLPTITNRPPAANAGPDLMIDLPETATLTGSALDDGKPRGQLTYRWTLLSGPGTVTFGTPQAATTTANFSALGSYVIRLTVSDTELDDVDDVVVKVFQPGAPRTVQIPISSGADDAMEGGGSSGMFVNLASADVELGHSGPPSNTAMLDGLRFTGIPVPKDGEIVSAKIQFKVDETGSEAAAYTIRGEANDNAPTYQAVAGNISARPSTTATVPWSPPSWTLIGEAGPNQATADLKTIVQEIVNRPGWVEGNALAFMISGTGRRTAEAKDGLSPPVLVLEFRRLAPNTAPVVSAGLDAAIQLPAQAALDGTVTDDGQPQAMPTTTWSMVSGPGTVTFGNPALVDTTATFSAPGAYVLRLTASDGLLSTFDDVAVAVERADAAPVMNAGPDQAIQLPAGATLDGTVVDPGYSGPVTTAWSKVSGPGTVTFGDASALDTTATFSAAGSYTLRLTGTNAKLSGQDTMVVAVERANAAPVVNAGLDAAIQLPAQAPLDGTVTDDGQPQVTPTTTWSKVSGPGTVTFGNPALVDTTATFSAPGAYVLRLTASDGLLSTFDDVAVAVERADAAPVMNAGPDQAIQLPAGATLDGTVVDPGYSGPVTTAWSKVSGPGTVTFGDASALDTTATFSAAGSYTLRLAGTNAKLSGQDTMVVAVERANAAPAVSAGPDRTTRIPLPASIDGTLVDAGYPGRVHLKWSKVSGPGTVSFGDASALDTTATLSTAGTYTLRLTASNDLFSTSDDVQVVAQEPLLTISLQADSDAVVASDEVDLTGRVVRRQDAEPVAGEEVDVWVTRAPGTSPELLGTVVTGADGGFALVDQPLVNSTYRAQAGEDASEAEAVLVSPRATARTARPSVMVGQRSRLGGVVEPGVTGQPVRLQRWNGSGWATIAQKTLAAGSTRYSFDLPTGRSRRTSYRVFVPAYAGRSQTTTAPVVVDVYRVRISAVNTAREYVTLENTGHTNADLRGWTLTNPGSGITRVLPAFTLRPGRSVRIHSGVGVNDWNDVYLGRRAMWGTHGTAVVRNIQRVRIDKFRF